MSSIQLIKPPKSKRAIREVAKKDPQPVEFIKTAMFIKVPQTSQYMSKVLTDLVRDIKLRLVTVAVTN